MTQAPDRKRYEGQIDGLVIKQTRNGADYVEVKLLRERMQYPDTCRGFNEDIVALMRDVELGSYAMLLIDESPGMYQGKPITNRNIVGYEAIPGPSGDPAVEGYYREGVLQTEEEDELYGGPVKSNAPPPEQKPYVSSQEQTNRNIHASVALEQAVRAHGNFSEPTAKEILNMAHMFYKGLRWISSTDGLEGDNAEA